MKTYLNRYFKHAAAILFFVSMLYPINGAAENGSQKQLLREAKVTRDTVEDLKEAAVFDKSNSRIQAVMAVQNRHSGELMAIKDIVGTATGLSYSGAPSILVFAKKEMEGGTIPEYIEGTPVIVQVTGEIVAMKGLKPNNTVAFPLPVPIGVSTGNRNECSSGTIGARVKDGSGNIYALSNNHVYALENNAPIGSIILQPGLYDTQCLVSGNNTIGTLFDYVRIDFSGGANTVDAAIALSSTSSLGNATPSTGYGTPNSATVSASLGKAVQKYGRTTSLTSGNISGINGTVLVNYGSAGTATFVNQIFVSSNKPFIKAGDSGSLLVTNDANANPVGLLFAGSSSGTFAIANQIDDVLASLKVTIDGK